MSRRDLPLWVRGVAVLLLLGTSWWLLHTDALLDIVGVSVVLVGLGVVTVSIVFGMGRPLGLWPAGPWRDRFVSQVAVVPALVFGALVILAGPAREPTLVTVVDPGLFLLAAMGVVSLGFGVSYVTQRPFVAWSLLAVVVALAPTVITVPLGGVTSTWNADVCWLSILDSRTGSGCLITYPRSLIFLGAVLVPSALVSVELAFRRLLLGVGGGAGLVVVVLAAAVATTWAYVIGPDALPLAREWWIVAAGAVTAGSLYALSGSLPVSALYTGFLVAGIDAVSYAAMDPDARLAALAPLGAATLAHAAIALGLLAFVARRNGLLAGLR